MLTSNDYKVIVKRCPYGALFVEGGEERQVISRFRVMKELGRILDRAGSAEVEIKFQLQEGDSE